ncbi:MAG: ATP-binding cassette domain-containing protein, partial [Alphaproteobacteria bacterium]|nr:ATP-binding cassette domain-containing protein [Alphaproteobacteria bacterium]
MITFKSIKWKNFLSTGNAFTEIKLNENANALIIGENGSGKSTILDALTFALFGKPFRKINKPALVNSVNDKGCV